MNIEEKIGKYLIGEASKKVYKMKCTNCGYEADYPKDIKYIGPCPKCGENTMDWRGAKSEKKMSKNR